MAIIGYSRVSTTDQRTESQEENFGTHQVEKVYRDHGISGTVKALEREGFKACFEYLREGDTLVIAAIDRLGRDTIDVLNTVKSLQGKGVKVVSIREGFDLSTPVGEAMLTMLAAMAKLERTNIKIRQMAGIERARQEGKKLGREFSVDPLKVKHWREKHGATLSETAKHFKISKATVCKYLKHSEV